MTNYELLVKHYILNHKNKVFRTKLFLTNGTPGVMFLYNKSDELMNFKNAFGLYLPIYTKNEDNLQTMNFNGNIDDNLKLYSKRIWNESNVVPHRLTSINGIYGELFMDIYLRVVENKKTLISYASKRSFNSNYESKGIDSIVYTYKNDIIEFYMCEAKFVSDKNAAKSELMKDISKGKIPHLTAEYLNDYFGFVLEKDLSCPIEDRRKINDIFMEFNKAINDIAKPLNFVDLIIAKNIKIHFICFAIFQGLYQHPDMLDSIYIELLDEINIQFNNIGIKNRSSEIVFIPTDNSSMTIKKEIDSFYE